MSDTDTEIMPKPHTLYKTSNGLCSYRAALTKVYVDQIGDGNVVLDVSEDGQLIRLRLNAEQVGHLIDLLRPGKN